MPHKSHWERTSGRIRKLMYRTVETGAITAVAGGVDLSLFLAPDAKYHLVMSFILGSLYTNIVIATLSNRLSQTNAEGSISDVNILSEVFRSRTTLKRSREENKGVSREQDRNCRLMNQQSMAKPGIPQAFP
ncbi:hypothetical protein IW262DRAFT_1289871 [Armillaria fumosa]|nr:hypothetical protein IW262DRAFT_1289871 [Armillaria fumosa]